MTLSFEGNPLTQGHEVLSRKTGALEAAQSEDFVILACTVLTQYSSVTDGRTDGQTPWPWLRRAKHSAIARKNSVARLYTDVVRLTGVHPATVVGRQVTQLPLALHPARQFIAN